MLNKLDVYCVFWPFRFFGPVPELLTAKNAQQVWVCTYSILHRSQVS